MAREKTTLTIDRGRLDEARRLTGARSGSETVDLALTALIREIRLRKDFEAYAGRPPTDDEIALASLPANWSDLADDTDWDDLYKADGK